MLIRCKLCFVALSLLFAMPAVAQLTDSAPDVADEAPVVVDDNGEIAEPEPKEEQQEEGAADVAAEEAAKPSHVIPGTRADDSAIALPDDDNTEAEEVEEDTGPQPIFAVASAAIVRNPDIQVRGNKDNRDLGWQLTLGGYIRTQYTTIQADPELQLYGRNDGFMMADARTSLLGELDNGLGFVFELDAAATLGTATVDSPVARQAVRMTDVYIFYAPLSFLQLTAGQFKAPFEVEDLISTSQLLFVERSVGSRGVHGIEGRNIGGLAVGREVGAQLGGHYFPMAEGDTPDGIGVSYAAAITNGSPENRNMNSNDRHAFYGRAGLHWGELVALGGAYFQNDNTFGDPPNRIDRILSGFTADLQVNAFGLTVLGSMTQRSTETPDLPANPEVTAMAYQFQIAYEEPFFGFQPAYRFAFYDPTHAYGDSDTEKVGIFEQDALTYHTIGLNYNAKSYPIRMMFNYTLAMEQEGREIDNDRFDALLQLTW